MGALAVVDAAPAVELRLRQSLEVTVRQHFGLERAMEALVFTVGLRMQRAAVREPDAQANQPDRQSAQGFLASGAPGRTIVGVDLLGQAILGEDPLQRTCTVARCSLAQAIRATL